MAPPAKSNGLAISAATFGVTGLAIGIGAWAWWSDKTFQPLHLKETGYLGEHTYAGGSDKTGHLFSNYLAVKTITAIYEELGVEHNRALLMSSGLVFLIAQSVELIDGFTEFGFEYQDVEANLVGWVLAILTELSPELDSVVGMRIGYVPSGTHYLGENGLRTYINIINDYSGQIIYADLKLDGALRMMHVAPGPARYFLVGVNWGTNGYSPKNELENSRNLGFHVSLAADKVIEDLDLGTAGGVAGAFLKYYALPFITVTATKDLNHDDWYIGFGLSNRATIGAN